MRLVPVSLFIALSLAIFPYRLLGQTLATAKATTDATRISVGDQVRVFIEAHHHQKAEKLIWASIPDSFDHLEVVEKGKIDTSIQNDIVTYKQRLLVTGFDSGSFKIPSFVFIVTTKQGSTYSIQTDSFQLEVNTIPVDTTKPFKPIKEIMEVKTTWRDYIWLIVGGVLFIALAVFVVLYFLKNKKAPVSFVPKAPKETLQEETLRLLSELESKQLWQNDRIKEYYSELTDILRVYIEKRFGLPAPELTSDEILDEARKHPELHRHHKALLDVLYTADLAKFAKAQPLPADHINGMQHVKEFVNNTQPLITTTNTPIQS